MSSRFMHGDDAKRLGVLVEAATEEWNKSLRAVEAGVLQLSLTRAPRLFGLLITHAVCKSHYRHSFSIVHLFLLFIFFYILTIPSS